MWRRIARENAVNDQGVFGPGVSGLCGSRGRAIEVNRPYLVAETPAATEKITSVNAYRRAFLRRASVCPQRDVTRVPLF
jgi:hypothetical protein